MVYKLAQLALENMRSYPYSQWLSPHPRFIYPFTSPMKSRIKEFSNNIQHLILHVVYMMLKLGTFSADFSMIYYLTMTSFVNGIFE